MVKALEEVTSTKAPAPIAALDGAVPRFNNVCEKQDMCSFVLQSLGVEQKA